MFVSSYLLICFGKLSRRSCGITIVSLKWFQEDGNLRREKISIPEYLAFVVTYIISKVISYYCTDLHLVLGQVDTICMKKLILKLHNMNIKPTKFSTIIALLSQISCIMVLSLNDV